MGGEGAPRGPYDANEEQRRQIALVLKTIENRVDDIAEYRPMRLLAAGVAGAGNAFAIHFLTDLVMEKLCFAGTSRFYAPTGIAVFHVGGSTGRRLLQPPHSEEGIFARSML